MYIVAAAPTLSEFLTSVGTFLTSAISWLGEVLDTITSNPPLLVMCLAIPISGFAVGLLKRITRV